MSREVYVVGIGLFTSVGADAASTWRNLLDGVSGVRRISRFNTEGLPAQIAAMVDDDASLSCGRRCEAMARSAIAEAVADAGLRSDQLSDCGVYLAAPTPDNDWSAMLTFRSSSVRNARKTFFSDEFVSGFGDAVSAPFCLRSPPILVNTACASGATALEIAMEAIQDGEHDLAVVAGSDSSIYEESLAKFCLLSALSTGGATPTQACRPFSADRDGFVMGEGAGAVILASARALERYGLTPLARLAGAGNATDGFHRTRSSPDGSSIIASMSRALENAGLASTSIDHINAHGTGTPENDKMESLGIRAVFGPAYARVPVTANKSMLGHTLTAAGIIEAAISVLTIRHGVIPPTINHDLPDTDLGVQIVGNRARRADVNHVLSNSFGFGGQNVTLVLSRADGG